MTSSVWTNTSVTSTLVNARAEYAPFGPNGLILLLGGTSGDSPSGLVDFTNITFYDPVTKQFFSQQATGTIPTGRQRFCSVGVTGPNKTYEVFMYGGLMADNTVSDEVFVLSLPGFVFAKADDPGATTARADHTCVTVGGGKRQMLSVGGTDASRGYPAEFADPDPWSQGLGVLDMTSLRWTDGYVQDAAAYDTPEVVKQFYRDGGLGKVQWTSDELEGFFTNDADDEDDDRFEISRQPTDHSIESNRKGQVAPPSIPLARRSLEQYSVHIKGNATPIIIDNAPSSTNAATEAGTARLLNPAAERQQQQAAVPPSKRVRFSALLRPPQRKPVPALQPQQALRGNKVTIRSELADRRGRPALQAIRTRVGQAAPGESGLVKGDIHVYQERPSWPL
ncbi:hypothetical protein Daus18300_000961 [Diaporthe australafricana]|uniref:Kelch repeat protein n=1 Tax=Diaporthe australafricana TaxID=127596 RepID=A0ABR3Y259_9PEZI